MNIVSRGRKPDGRQPDDTPSSALCLPESDDSLPRVSSQCLYTSHAWAHQQQSTSVPSMRSVPSFCNWKPMKRLYFFEICSRIGHDECPGTQPNVMPFLVLQSVQTFTVTEWQTAGYPLYALQATLSLEQVTTSSWVKEEVGWNSSVNWVWHLVGGRLVNWPPFTELSEQLTSHQFPRPNSSQWGGSRHFPSGKTPSGVGCSSLLSSSPREVAFLCQQRPWESLMACYWLLCHSTLFRAPEFLLCTIHFSTASFSLYWKFIPSFVFLISFHG